MTNRLNILINKPTLDAPRMDGSMFTGVSVVVRQGYSPVPDAGGPVDFIAVPMGEVWQPDAINNAGRRGGFGVDVDVQAIERAVASLMAVWGDVPVQDNSGRCAHLATAPGVLAI